MKTMVVVAAVVLVLGCDEPPSLAQRDCETRMQMALTRADTLAVLDHQPGLADISRSWYSCAALITLPRRAPTPAGQP